MKLVSFEQAAHRLRRDTDVDDPDIEFLIKAASKAVVSYIGTEHDFFDSDGQVLILDSNGDPGLDSNGDSIVPEDIQIATLLLIGEFYVNRGGNQTGFTEQNYLPPSVKALLFTYRALTAL